MECSRRQEKGGDGAPWRSPSSDPAVFSRKASGMGGGNRTCEGTSKRYQLCHVQVSPP